MALDQASGDEDGSGYDESIPFGILIPILPLVCLLCNHERPLVKDMDKRISKHVC